MWERHSLQGLNISGNHNDNNIREVHEQSQCHGWDRVDESNKDFIQEVEDGAVVEMPHKSFDSRHRSANINNNSSLGIKGGGRSIPLH